MVISTFGLRRGRQWFLVDVAIGYSMGMEQLRHPWGVVREFDRYDYS